MTCRHSPALLNGTTTLQIKWLVDNMHVGTRKREVLHEIWSRLPKGQRVPTMRPIRHAAYRVALARHESNRETYRIVMGGGL